MKRIFCVGEDFYFEAAYSGYRFSRLAILNVAMLLPKSQVAREYADAVLEGTAAHMTLLMNNTLLFRSNGNE